jgi:hypothetical protein
MAIFVVKISRPATKWKNGKMAFHPPAKQQFDAGIKI